MEKVWLEEEKDLILSEQFERPLIIVRKSEKE